MKVLCKGVYGSEDDTGRVARVCDVLIATYVILTDVF